MQNPISPEDRRKNIFLKGSKVYLNLPEKEYKPVREIGYLKGRTFHTSRDPNHIFRKLNAIALNYELLTEGEAYFDYIEIQFGEEVLRVSRDEYLRNGIILHFKKNQLDQQCFLNLDHFQNVAN
jgi:hypothetical protein